MLLFSNNSTFFYHFLSILITKKINTSEDNPMNVINAGFNLGLLVFILNPNTSKLTIIRYNIISTIRNKINVSIKYLFSVFLANLIINYFLNNI